MSESGWVLRSSSRDHRCPTPLSGSFGSPDGVLGDLWRCPECRTLWRIGRGCHFCDAYGPGFHTSGSHRTGLAWRVARFWDHVRASFARARRGEDREESARWEAAKGTAGESDA